MAALYGADLTPSGVFVTPGGKIASPPGRASRGSSRWYASRFATGQVLPWRARSRSRTTAGLAVEQRQEAQAAAAGLDALQEFAARFAARPSGVTPTLDAAAAQVLAAFRQAGVEALLLKGRALAICSTGPMSSGTIRTLTSSWHHTLSTPPKRRSGGWVTETRAAHRGSTTSAALCTRTRGYGQSRGRGISR